MFSKNLIFTGILSLGLISSNAVYANGTSTNDFLITHPPINSGISVQDYKTYNFNQGSTEIYSPGVISVTVYPNNDEEIELKVFKRIDDVRTSLEANKRITVKAGKPQTFKFNVSGYTTVFVNSHYDSGKFNVVW